MGDITRKPLLVLKGLLFLLLAALGAAIILSATRSWQAAAVLAVTIWASCRFYYFCFYVIENYIDGEHRFAGVFDALRHLWVRRKE